MKFWVHMWRKLLIFRYSLYFIIYLCILFVIISLLWVFDKFVSCRKHFVNIWVILCTYVVRWKMKHGKKVFYDKYLTFLVQFCLKRFIFFKNRWTGFGTTLIVSAKDVWENWCHFCMSLSKIFLTQHFYLSLVDLKDCYSQETLKLFKLSSQCLERAQDLLRTSAGV